MSLVDYPHNQDFHIDLVDFSSLIPGYAGEAERVLDKALPIGLH